MIVRSRSSSAIPIRLEVALSRRPQPRAAVKIAARLATRPAEAPGLEATERASCLDEPDYTQPTASRASASVGSRFDP
jgi:hypothetical protein